MEVARGNTAGAIADRFKPAGVSLDQMLAAMLKANPDAFIQGNVNRLKAGAIVPIPTAEAASQTSAAEARKLIVAQSRDFNEFRQRLANAAPKAPVVASAREATGQVQTEVTDRQTQAKAEDKLTLSKGKAQNEKAAENIAQQKAAEEVAQQKREAAKNVEDLAKLQAAINEASSAPTVATSTPNNTTTPTAETVAAPAPATPEPTQQAVTTPPAPAAMPTLAGEEASLIERLSSHPWTLPGAGALLALLALQGISRSRRNRASESATVQGSSFLDPTIQPDSSFGLRGTQRIDTAEMPSFQVSAMESPTGGSSLMYSPSQLDAAGDVDPVAEADVYLAYGKDIQAEEILNEALRTQPDRLPVRMKLLEIQARRQDKVGFQEGAARVQQITGGQGPEWATVMAWGRGLDPQNSLYTDEAEASSLPLEGDDPIDTARSALAAGPYNPTSAFDVLNVNLDLDLGKGATVAQDHRATSPMPVDGFGLNQASSAVDIDFGDRNLELQPQAAAVAPSTSPSSAGGTQAPLQTKLVLAREFLSIGDTAAARAMAQEVLEQGNESLQAEAKALLASLG